MSPNQNDLDEEIRGHLALSIRERIERGEDPASARLAALKEFGNVTLTRDSMRGVWHPRWLDALEAFGRELRFAAMQSETGQAALRRLGLPLAEFETFLLLDGEAVYGKSDAFLRLLRYLRRPWPWFRWVRIVPRGLRDWGYDRIARNRYRLFGRRATCLVPGREVADRFLR